MIRQRQFQQQRGAGFTLVELPAVSKRERGAFTLVELLVVIGIIAVLIGVLLPALSRARQNAMILKCAANERSIGQAMFIYASLNKGALPPFYYDDGQLRPVIAWRSWDQCLIDTVLKLNREGTSSGAQETPTWGMFACPADIFTRDPRQSVYVNTPIRSYAVNQSKWGYGLIDSGSGVTNGSFKMPWSGGCLPGNVGSFDPRLVKAEKLSKIPPHVWLLGENWGTTSVYTMQNVPMNDPANNHAIAGWLENSAMEGSPARFHGRANPGTQWTGTGNGVGSTARATANEGTGGNYLWADGHVEFVKFSAVVAIRADSDPGSNKTLLEDHWKWRTSK